MKDSRFLKILELLVNSEDKMITGNMLAEKLKLSRKAALQVLKNLNSNLSDNGAQIIGKPGNGNGYKLIINNQNFFNKYLEELHKHNDYDFSFQRERIEYIVIRFLEQKDYLKIVDLSQELYISERQVSKDLIFVKRILSEYQLSIETIPHHGMIISGSESNIRLCYSIIYRNHKSNNDEKLIKSINDIVIPILNKNNIELFDSMYENFILHIFIMLKRIKSGFTIDDNTVTNWDIKNDDLEISKEILFMLSRTEELTFTSGECKYIAMHLSCKEKNDSNITNSINQEIYDLVLAFLGTIDNSYNLKLKNDFNLCMSMSVHFVPMLKRLELGSKIKNPLIDEIKDKFLYEFELARTGSVVISEKYHTNLSDDEIAYLALHLKLSLDSKGIQNKKKIIIICSSGRTTAEMLRLQFMEYFKEFIDVLEVAPLAQVPKIDFNVYDYIFTTVPLDIDTNIPVFKINHFLEDGEYVCIREFIDKTMTADEFQYFSKNLFFTNLKGKEYKEVISEMVNLVSKTRTLPPEFEEEIIKREELAPTSFANRVALLHPRKMLTEDTFIAVGILEKPIDWAGKETKMVLLISLSKNKKGSMKSFYRMISDFIHDKQLINLIDKNKNFEVIENWINGRKGYK